MMNENRPPKTAEELFIRYLEKHPGHVSDLIFVLEVKAERVGGDGESPIPTAR